MTSFTYFRTLRDRVNLPYRELPVTPQPTVHAPARPFLCSLLGQCDRAGKLTLCTLGVSQKRSFVRQENEQSKVVLISRQRVDAPLPQCTARRQALVWSTCTPVSSAGGPQRAECSMGWAHRPSDHSFARGFQRAAGCSQPARQDSSWVRAAWAWSGGGAGGRRASHRLARVGQGVRRPPRGRLTKTPCPCSTGMPTVTGAMSVPTIGRRTSFP
jgi:hypothetical protein